MLNDKKGPQMAIDEVVHELEAEMIELRAKLGRVETAYNALTALDNTTPAAKPATAAPAPAPTRHEVSAPVAPRTTTRRRRGPHGTRGDQALSLIQSHPGITIPQMAEAMKIEPNYLYRVLPKLVEDGKVEKRGEHGWYKVETEAAAAPAAA